jgi:hypothetical protein
VTRQRAVAEREGQARRRRDGKGARCTTASRLDTLRPVTVNQGGRHNGLPCRRRRQRQVLADGISFSGKPDQYHGSFRAGHEGPVDVHRLEVAARTQTRKGRLLRGR